MILTTRQIISIKSLVLGLGGVVANAVGYARGSFYVYKQIYDQKTGKPIENLFVDKNNDGILNSSDLYILNHA